MTTAKKRYDWKGAEERAARGTVPRAPDFSAPTHHRHRNTFSLIKQAVKAKDAAALKKIRINPVASTSKAMHRYRNICVTALTAKAAS